MDADPRALLRAYLDTFPVPPPVPVTRSRPGTVADLPLAPGPQPWNGGITPGYEPPRPPDDPATLADLAEAGGNAEADRRWLEGTAQRLSRENWELARWVAQLETVIEDLKAGRDVAQEQCQGRGEGGSEGGRQAG